MDYFRITAKDLGKHANIPILKLGDSGEVFYELALEMIRVIRDNHKRERPTVIICPVGPTGQYPVFVRIVNREKLSLKNCWFINMDDYLDDNGGYIEKDSPLSFRGYMDREVYEKIDSSLLMPPKQRVFPDPANPGYIPELIRQLGGVDLVIGGIGINGHLAFNEPNPELSVDSFASLTTRVLPISPETRAINAASSLGGALATMPEKCVTVGMQEILTAKKIRLGVFREWHRAVVRQAAYGEVSASFPATLAQRHPNALIITNQLAAQQPY